MPDIPLSMKICVVIIFFSFFSAVSFCQTDRVNSAVVSPIRIDRRVEIKWAQLADSIVLIKETCQVPKFLLNECLDMKPSLWKDSHSPTSVRWEILKLVSDTSALKFLLAQKQMELTKSCESSEKQNREYPWDIISPLNNISTLELVQRRLDSLIYRQ